jgi:hypothetical protein
MDERRKSPVTLIVVLAAPVVIVALYVVGYFRLALPDELIHTGPPFVIRDYPHPVVGWLYYPAAFVEAKVERKFVIVGSADGKSLYSVEP